jgi:hypothetical protein
MPFIRGNTDINTIQPFTHFLSFKKNCSIQNKEVKLKLIQL